MRGRLPSTELDPLSGDALLDAVTDAMVALHLRHHGRAPATARTQLLGDDLLVCVLGGVYTHVEQTMIEVEGPGEVHGTRQRFQQATRQKFVGAVERLTGRSVVSFISSYNVGPDQEVELFLLAPGDQRPG